MGYPVGWKEHIMLSSEGRMFVTASNTGEKGRFTPFFTPHILKRVVVIGVTSRSLGTKPVWSIRLATKVGQASATGQQQETITMTSGNSRNKVMYSDHLNVNVPPGREIIIHQTTAATGTLNVRIGLIVQPNWEQPANNTDMIATA